MYSGQVMWVLHCSRHFHVSAWLTQQATQEAVASSPIRSHSPQDQQPHMLSWCLMPEISQFLVDGVQPISRLELYE